MPSLRDTQAAFSAAIRSGDAGTFAALILDGGISPERRVQIYRNNHRLAALATLQATYPVVARLGGTDWFAQSAHRYQQDCPSRCGDLQFLGESFPQFLRTDLAGTPYAYFADVAALEWAYQEVLTAAQSAIASLQALQAVDPQDYAQLMFRPRAALRTVESPFPIFAIWHANQPSAPAAEAIRLDSGASRVLLIRRVDHVELRELAIPSWLLLRQFQRGATLGAAADAVAGDAGEFDLELCLRELLGLGTIADIGLNAGEHR